MTEDRKTIIIKEIQYWKDSHLLPSRYCDFLLALYTEGDLITSGEEPTEKSDQDQINISNVILIASNIFLLPITFLLLYFTELNYFRQFIFSLLMLVVSIGFYIVSIKKFKLNIAYAFIILLTVFFLLSVTLIHQTFNSLLITTIVAACQSLSWIGLGYRNKSKFLIILGSLGSIVSLLYYFF